MPALLLWCVSMGWLISTKVLPALTAGKPPQYEELLPKTTVSEPEPIRWSIRWNGNEIGWAENKISRSFDGTGQIRSEVQFQQLPVDQMLQDVMGVIGRFAKPFVGEIGELDLRVLTELNFDQYGALGDFHTDIDVGSLEDLLQIVGRVQDDKLDLTAHVRSTSDEPKEIFRRRSLSLPPNALVADSFSPRPRLADIRVGQTWTFQSYQPLMPHSPLTVIEATVEGEELIDWNGQMVRTRKVVFRKDSGSGISSTRRPISESWVMHDGNVLRQDLWLANVKVQFVRNESKPQKNASTTQEDAETE